MITGAMVTIRCLVANSVLRGSSLWGEHGVSLLVEIPEGRVLMDCGQSGEVLLHNAREIKNRREFEGCSPWHHIQEKGEWIPDPYLDDLSMIIETERGLVKRPVIAVPTSIGYGASFSGVAALLGMLNSCAAGVTVVNIDNGFGAGYAASLMNYL